MKLQISIIIRIFLFFFKRLYKIYLFDFFSFRANNYQKIYVQKLGHSQREAERGSPGRQKDGAESWRPRWEGKSGRTEGRLAEGGVGYLGR